MEITLREMLGHVCTLIIVLALKLKLKEDTAIAINIDGYFIYIFIRRKRGEKTNKQNPGILK